MQLDGVGCVDRALDVDFEVDLSDNWFFLDFSDQEKKKRRSQQEGTRPR